MRCPRCGARLHSERDDDVRALVPYCLACGWRHYEPAVRPARRLLPEHWRRPPSASAGRPRPVYAVSAAAAIAEVLADGRERLASEVIAVIRQRYGHSKTRLSHAATVMGVERGYRPGYSGSAGNTWRLPAEQIA